jgi:hypothetical protein
MRKRIHSGSHSRSKAIAQEAAPLALEEKALSQDQGWVVGCVGCGKTSGSGRSITLAFLESGRGRLIVSAKTKEKKLFEPA